MNLSAFYQECVQKKEEQKLSAKDISAVSMASQATVSRFFNNNGEGVSLSSLRAIGDALGVEFPVAKSSASLSAPADANRYLQVIEDLYETRLDKHGKLYEQMIMHKDAELKRVEKSRVFFVGLSVALIIFICALFFIDIINPSFGWFQY